MATTTPNYGWTVPTSTDLVKDGATAIETLGDSVDATVKALNPETTLGDIAYRSATANTNTRLAIGTTGQVLAVSGGVPAWTTVSSGGMTLLATVTAAAATSVSFTSISGSYKHLFLTWEQVYSNVNDTRYWTVRFNNDSAGNYYWSGTRFGSVSIGEFSQSAFGNAEENAPILGGAAIADAGYSNYGSMWIRDYADAGRGTGVDWRSQAATNGTIARYCQFIGAYSDTSAITRIDFIRNSTQTVTGTFRLYGVS